MSTIFAILALLFLDAPWKWLVAGTLLVIDIFEIMVWMRWRERRSITGSENMTGQIGEAIDTLDPEGQVKLRGQIWKARSTEPVTAGGWVKVDGIEGLTLLVSPSEGPFAGHGAQTAV